MYGVCFAMAAPKLLYSSGRAEFTAETRAQCTGLLKDWVAVKELSLDYHVVDIYIYTYIRYGF